MNQILAKLEDLKNMPTKNKVALLLLVVLSLAVIVKYFPESSESSSTMELTTQETKVQNKAPSAEASQAKLTGTEIEATKKIIVALQKYPQGIYLTRKTKNANLESIAQSSQIMLTNLQLEKNIWKLSGTGENLANLEIFINNLLKEGLESTKADLRFIDPNWSFELELKSINQE